MANRLIAIIGSVQESRNYGSRPGAAPEMVSADQAKAAAEAARLLGRELAEAGYRLLVYSGKAEFIDRHVVAGYIASGKAKAKSVEIEYPRDRETAAKSFPEYTDPDKGEVFDPRPHRSPDWDVSLYRSLGRAHGSS